MSEDFLSKNKRLAKNTFVLYLRMIVIMLIGLYISRAVLDTIGVEDYGIYNVVGGFVTMFTILSASLSNAISRYITFELGKGNQEKLKCVFSTSVTVQFILAVIIAIILEIIGLWFLNYKMRIPQERIYAANWVLQCSILTFVINLISIPYNGCIIAHEKMAAFAYISIFETVMKLLSVLALYFVVTDKLIIYSIFLALSAIVVRIVYGIYCSKNFAECKYTVLIDKKLIKEMLSMASWNFLGSSGAVLNNQGINLLMNLFFGVTLNAARGISMQVNSVIQQFAGNFTTALNPQITKNYALGSYEEMRKLVYRGAKFSFFLMFLGAFPIIVETPMILQLWLKNVPENTVIFVRLVLLLSLTTVLSNILFTVAMANGDIKKYQLVVGCLSLSCFFFTYLAYKLGGGAEYAYYIAFLVDVVILIARLFIVNNLVNICIIGFIKEVLLRALAVSCLSFIAPIMLKYILNKSILSSIGVVACCIASSVLCIYYIGLNTNEKKLINRVINSKMLKSI